jgi:hypothetical protein
MPSNVNGRATQLSPWRGAPLVSPTGPICLRENPVWRGRRLMVCGRLVATVVPDATWPKMWRVKLPNGHVTDMVNLTRAKDAALALGGIAPEVVQKR